MKNGSRIKQELDAIVAFFRAHAKDSHALFGPLTRENANWGFVVTSCDAADHFCNTFIVTGANQAEGEELRNLVLDSFLRSVIVIEAADAIEAEQIAARIWPGATLAPPDMVPVWSFSSDGERS